METETHAALWQFRLALMLMWWPPTVKEKVSARAAVASPVASPTVMAKLSSRVILASHFMREQAGAKLMG